MPRRSREPPRRYRADFVNVIEADTHVRITHVSVKPTTSILRSQIYTEQIACQSQVAAPRGVNHDLKEEAEARREACTQRRGAKANRSTEPFIFPTTERSND
jgi:hypothetical protein